VSSGSRFLREDTRHNSPPPPPISNCPPRNPFGSFLSSLAASLEYDLFSVLPPQPPCGLEVFSFFFFFFSRQPSLLGRPAAAFLMARRGAADRRLPFADMVFFFQPPYIAGRRPPTFLASVRFFFYVPPLQIFWPPWICLSPRRHFFSR